MSAVAIQHHRRFHLPMRTLLLATVGAVAAVGAVVALTRGGEGDTTVRADAPARVTATPTDAIATWLVDHRDTVFPGATGGYLGTCPTDAPGFTVGLCSSLTEDLGDVQLHLVGAYATDWGADLLLERTANAWSVTAVSPWPELGTRYDGSPWSPITAVTGWWYDRAAERYGAGAVHLHRCADALGAADTGQPLLCSTVVATSDEQRIYDSGLAGAPPDVRITVLAQPDHTWTVTDVAER